MGVAQRGLDPDRDREALPEVEPLELDLDLDPELDRSDVAGELKGDPYAP